MRWDVPKEILAVAAELEHVGFQAYLVGGCVRDLLLGYKPKDWDVTTNASPEEIQQVFPDSVYENKFGTVGVKTDAELSELKVVEVTTFRKEGRYTDKRHPDEIKFADRIEDDLSRRDFTVNALALNFSKGKFDRLVDRYGGEEDIKNEVIKTVGRAKDRFEEDALRLMRAVRLSTELNFRIDFETRRAIEEKAGLLEMIAKERIRDELVKILMAKRAVAGIILLEELDLLRYVIPELREGLGVSQNKHHIYSVFEHNVRSLDYTASKNYSLLIRLAALLHDVGKPQTKHGEGVDSTFYNHEMAGASMTLRILDRLRFPKSFTEKVVHLVRHHLFYYNVDEVTEAGVRRFLNRVGPENVEDLIKVREADRIGSGVPKAVPYKIRHLLFMVDKVKTDPVSPKMLKVDGGDIMKIASLDPSPKVGHILAILLEEILDDPENNSRDYLEKRIQDLGGLSEKKLQSMAEKARGVKQEFEMGVEEEIKKKHHVK